MKIKNVKNLKILIMGLPGSGKTTLAKKLSFLLKAKHLNADDIRTKFNDWDFSREGRERQSIRMNEISNELLKKNKIVVADFVCPLEKTREEFDADYIIWMDTIESGRFEDTNKMFIIPNNYDYKVEFKNADYFANQILIDIKKNFSDIFK